MITNDICKVLYALPGGVVVPRRQPLTKPLVATILGAVLLIINLVAIDDKAGALSMLTMVVGITLLMVGIIMIVVRLTSSTRVPYHTPSKRYMCYDERYYDRAQLAELKRYVAAGDRAKIEALPTGNISAVTLVECSAADDSLVAMAIYEYIELENRLVDSVKIIAR